MKNTEAIIIDMVLFEMDSKKSVFSKGRRTFNRFEEIYWIPRGLAEFLIW